MRKLTHRETALRKAPPPAAGDDGRAPVVVLLDNVRSLYNVGSIFRTSDGAGVRKLILGGYTPHPPRKEIEKTALGATLSVPWEHTADPRKALEKLKRESVRVCVLEHTDASVPYTGLTPAHFPLCLVVGNEITGVSDELVACADFAVDIPMHGSKQSLNAAVAFGIVVYGFLNILASGARPSTRRPAAESR